MMKKYISMLLSILFIAFALTGCNSETEDTGVIGRQPDSQVDSEVTDLQLVLLNHVSYKGDVLKNMEGKSIEGHEELIDKKYNNITGGNTLVYQLKGYTLVDFDDGDVTGFKAAAYTKGNSLVIVYCGTDGLIDVDMLENFSSGLFDFSAQDGQAKDFAIKNAKKYKDFNLYITGYSMGGRLCYLGTEAAYDNVLTGGLKRVCTFNGLGVKEAFDNTDGNLSNIHNLEVKFAKRTYNYIVNGDTVSDGLNYFVSYHHVGTDIKVACTNEIDGWPMKQHDLYSIIDYLLNGAGQETSSGGNTVAADQTTEPPITEAPTTEPPTTEAPAIQETSTDFLIGDWSTTDGVYLSFYDDGYFEMEWSYFSYEEGEWYAEAISEDTYYIEMDGSLILSMMSMLYGSADQDYHFEILKNNDNSFYLVQVYGDYTAYSSPCKLGFTRY